MANQEPIYLEVLTAEKCPFSSKAVKLAKAVVSKTKGTKFVMRELSLDSDEGQAKAKEMDIEATPAITINGRLAFVGVPSKPQLQTAISLELQRMKERNSCFF
ncbi:MAG: thioredoxin family protein [Candidatus Micrarchaeota archaeon]